MPQVAQNTCEGKEDNGDIPAAFPEDLTLREMKASFKSHKGALTRLSNQVKVWASSRRVPLLSLMNHTSSLLSATSYTVRLINWPWRTKRTQRHGCRHKTQLQPMQDTIERIYGDAQVQLGIGAPMPEMGTVAPGAAKVRVRHDLKPWELSASATPSEFRPWRQKY